MNVLVAKLFPKKFCPYHSKHSQPTVEIKLFELLLQQNIIKILIYVLPMICIIYVRG